MADGIAKTIEKYGNNFEGKVITDFIPSGYVDSLAEGKHKDACPTDAIGMNEWVLNHLPFGSEEQKKKFLDSLMKDQLVVNSSKKRDKTIKTTHKFVKSTRTFKAPQKSSIKERTKLS
jgi:hypothetical protein